MTRAIKELLFDLSWRKTLYCALAALTIFGMPEAALRIISKIAPSEVSFTLANISVWKPLLLQVDNPRFNYDVLHPIAITLWHALASLLTSTIVGLSIGAFAFRSQLFKSIVSPLSDFSRATPVTLMVPLVTTAFSGSSDITLISLASIPTTAMMVTYTLSALNSINFNKIHHFNLNENPPPLQKFKHLFLLALPTLIHGIRIIAAYSFVVACVLEMLNMGPENSAGKIISKSSIENSIIFSNNSLMLIFLLGFCSYLLNWLLYHVEKEIQERSFT